MTAPLTAADFNVRFPVGTRVVAYPGVRPEHPVAVTYQRRLKLGLTHDVDPCERLCTVTRTPAWTLGHGEPVVSVVGYAGGIALSHVDVADDVEATLTTAQARTDSPSDAAAYALDLTLVVHPEACATDADYGWWTPGMGCVATPEAVTAQAALASTERCGYQSRHGRCVLTAGHDWSIDHLPALAAAVPFPANSPEEGTHA